MRICSFLPSATEIIAELGFIDSLVGVSEECCWPPEVIGKPIVTAARIDPSKMSSPEIDEAVRASVREGHSLYMVDAELRGESCSATATVAASFRERTTRFVRMGGRTSSTTTASGATWF